MTWRCASAGRRPRHRRESLLRPLSLQLADGGVEDQVAAGPCEMKLAVCSEFTLAWRCTPGLLFSAVCLLWFLGFLFFRCRVSGGAEDILIIRRADSHIIFGV